MMSSKMVLFALFLTTGMVLVVNAFNFPVSPDQNCFVNFVFENNVYYEFPQQLQIPELSKVFQTNKTYIQSYTVHNSQNQNFSFDIEEFLFDDQISLSDGYFRFHSKYRDTCNLFLLLTASFNATTTAITNSGHGNSENTLFLVVVHPQKGNDSDHEDLLVEFSTQFKLLEAETKYAFYANLAFVYFQDLDASTKMEIYAFCYYCPESVGHLHLLKYVSSISTSLISLECKRLNSDGYERSIYILTLNKVPQERRSQLYKPIGEGRDSFYKTIRNHYIAVQLIFLIITKEINMTIHSPVYQFDIEDETEVYWHLSLKEISSAQVVIRNLQAITRSTYKLHDQATLKAMYCMESSDVLRISWDIYLRVLDYPTWILLGVTLLAYAFLYQNLFKAFDLIWIMFDMEFWLKHPRKILIFYLIGAVFLPWAYESGMSTDFVNFDNPSNINEILKFGYRIWVNELEAIRKSTNLWPEHARNSFLKDININFVSEMFSEMYEYKFPITPRKQVEAMAKNKLLLPNGIEPLFNFPSLAYALKERDVVVAENDFVCGTVTVTSRYGFQLANTFQIQGYMSTKFLQLLAISEQIGMHVRFQSLIAFQKAITRKLKVEDLSSALSSSTLAVRTPLGAVCAAYVVLNLMFLICNSVWMLYFNWIAVYRKILNSLRRVKIRSFHVFDFRTRVLEFEDAR
ncbi:unnamed protein product [Orchesella dallaii]|uniref:Uncharacterized protein n=1 Tax=Orchesella dallaii TaxID=48710 RepID=A0ABP1PIQ1_9HEXA